MDVLLDVLTCPNTCPLGMHRLGTYSELKSRGNRIELRYGLTLALLMGCGIVVQWSGSEISD